MSVKTRPDRAITPTPTIARGTALGICLALASTMAVFLLGNLGAPIRVVTGSNSAVADLSVGEVVVTASVSVVLAGLVLWLLERRRADGLRTWERTVVVVAILSALPLLRLEIDAASKASLVAMHLLTGAAAITAHRIVRRSGPAV